MPERPRYGPPDSTVIPRFSGVRAFDVVDVIPEYDVAQNTALVALIAGARRRD